MVFGFGLCVLGVVGLLAWGLIHNCRFCFGLALLMLCELVYCLGFLGNLYLMRLLPWVSFYIFVFGFRVKLTWSSVYSGVDLVLYFDLFWCRPV